MTVEEKLALWYERCRQISPSRLAGIDRKRIATFFTEWGFKSGAEIGVDRGRFSEYMLLNNPELHLLLVDQWRFKLRGPERYKSTLERVEPFGDRVKIIRDTSMNAVQKVPDASLDFVYVDADHTFDFVMQDIICWAKKVRPGGLVMGHDYYRFRGGGVVEAVDAYTLAHGITQWFITDEKTPTWFWLQT